VCDEDLRWERVEIASRDEVNKEKEKESENTEGPSARVDHILIAAPAREGETTRAYLFGGFSSATRTTTNETWLITRRKGTPLLSSSWPIPTARSVCSRNRAKRVSPAVSVGHERASGCPHIPCYRNHSFESLFLLVSSRDHHTFPRHSQPPHKGGYLEGKATGCTTTCIFITLVPP